jgi:hypothetical protein
MAFKTFVAGDILTAGQVNDYLMKQAVIVCTSGTRPSSPPEGMVIYETDTNWIMVYDGTAWQRVHPANISTRTNGAAITTSGTGESTIASIAVPAQNFPYRVRVTAQVFRTQTVTADSFALSIKNGAAITATSRGSGTDASLICDDYINVAGGGATTINVVLFRATGTGTASTFVDAAANFVITTIEAL